MRVKVTFEVVVDESTWDGEDHQGNIDDVIEYIQEDIAGGELSPENLFIQQL